MYRQFFKTKHMHSGLYTLYLEPEQQCNTACQPITACCETGYLCRCKPCSMAWRSRACPARGLRAVRFALLMSDLWVGMPGKGEKQYTPKIPSIGSYANISWKTNKCFSKHWPLIGQQCQPLANYWPTIGQPNPPAQPTTHPTTMD